MHSSPLHFELMYSSSNVDGLLFCYFLHPPSINEPILFLLSRPTVSQSSHSSCFAHMMWFCSIIVSLFSLFDSYCVTPSTWVFVRSVSTYCIIPSLLYSRYLGKFHTLWQQETNAGFDSPIQSTLQGREEGGKLTSTEASKWVVVAWSAETTKTNDDSTIVEKREGREKDERCIQA